MAQYRWRGMVSRRRALGLTGGAGATVFLIACGGGTKDQDQSAVREATREAGVIAGSQSQEEKPRAGGALAFPWAITPALDPVTQTSYQTHQLACFVYPRLYKFNTGPDPKTAQELQAVPDMAAAMPEVTDGGTRYVVKLRPDVKTHAKAPLNGRLYNSEDVRVSFEKYRTEPKNANRGAFGTDANPIVMGVETPDANTVVFKLAKPFAPFTNLIASPAYYWVMPKETGTGFDPAKEMVGAGPFIFESLQPDIAIKFRKHPDYFLQGQPYVDRFDLPIIADVNSRKAQFQAEKLDIFEPTHEDLKELKASNPKATIIKYPSRTYPFVFGQLKGSGPFKDERLRQAVSLAIDRDELLRLHWEGEGWWQNYVPVQLGKWWTDPKDPASKPATKWFGTGDRAKDLAEATALLKAAGYDESKKLRVKYYWTNNIYGDRYNQQAEAVMAMLKETKAIEPTALPVDYRNEWQKTGGGGIYLGDLPDDGLAYALQVPFPDAHDFVFNQLHSKSTRNHAGINDPELDALIDKQSTILDEAERVKAIKGIVARADEKAYMAPVMQGPGYFGLQPWVKGYTLGITYGWATESFINAFVVK